jgi:hypothetical protein
MHKMAGVIFLKKRDTCGQKRPLFTTERRVAAHLHRGRVVLRVRADLPVGEGAAAKHFTALEEALCAYAAQELLPVAAAELDDLVAAGRAHHFLPHRYTLTLQLCPRGRRVAVLLRATHCAGGACVRRVLHTLWRADGEAQYPLFSRRVHLEFL